MAVSANHNLGGCVIYLRLYLIDIVQKIIGGFRVIVPFRCKSKKCPKCSISGSAFPLDRNFVCHTKVCNGNGSFKCPHCDKIFTDYQAVRNHNYCCSRKNVCHICNFAAKNSEAMKKHVSKYHKKFSCKMCDYHCLDNRALTCHIQASTIQTKRTISCSTLKNLFIIKV